MTPVVEPQRGAIQPTPRRRPACPRTVSELSERASPSSTITDDHLRHDARSVASTLAHELLHVQGYDHEYNRTPTETQFYFNTVVSQIGQCVYSAGTDHTRTRTPYPFAGRGSGPTMSKIVGMTSRCTDRSPLRAGGSRRPSPTGCPVSTRSRLDEPRQAIAERVRFEPWWHPASFPRMGPSLISMLTGRPRIGASSARAGCWEGATASPVSSAAAG